MALTATSLRLPAIDSVAASCKSSSTFAPNSSNVAPLPHSRMQCRSDPLPKAFFGQLVIREAVEAVRKPRSSSVACAVASAAATPSSGAAKKGGTVEGKFTILVPEKLGEAGIELLRQYANVDLAYNLTPEELLAKVSLVDALIVRSATKVTREVFEAANGRLKVVGRAGVGIDNVDLQAATEVGCLVVNAPTANTVAAAEHGIALLAALSRNVAQANASMKAGEGTGTVAPLDAGAHCWISVKSDRFHVEMQFQQPVLIKKSKDLQQERPIRYPTEDLVEDLVKDLVENPGVLNVLVARLRWWYCPTTLPSGQICCPLVWMCASCRLQSKAAADEHHQDPVWFPIDLLIP